jgi:hypothetical protein
MIFLAGLDVKASTKPVAMTITVKRNDIDQNEPITVS